MKKEQYKEYLVEVTGADEVNKVMDALERLQIEYKTTLDNIVMQEEKVQELRTTIYFDTDLSPRDRKMYPIALKSYYTFVTGKDLPPMKFKKKGQQ